MVNNTTSGHLDNGNKTGITFIYTSTTRTLQSTTKKPLSTTRLVVQPDSEGEEGISTAVIIAPVVAALVIVAVIVGVIVWRRRSRKRPDQTGAATKNDPSRTLLPSVSAATKAPQISGNSSDSSSGNSNGGDNKNPISKLFSRFRGNAGKATKPVDKARNVPTIVIENDADGPINRSESASNGVQQTISGPERNTIADPCTEDYQGTYINCEPTAVHIGDSYIEFVSPNHEEEPEDYDYAYTYLCDSENGMGVYMGGDGSIYEDVDGLLREAAAGRDRVSVADIQDYMLPNIEPVRSHSQPDLQRRPAPLPKPPMSRTPEVARRSHEQSKQPMKVPDRFVKKSPSNECFDKAKEVEESTHLDKNKQSLYVNNANDIHDSIDSDKDKHSIMMRPKVRTGKLLLNSVKLGDIKSRLRLIATPADKEIHKSFVIKSDNTSIKDYEKLPAKVRKMTLAEVTGIKDSQGGSPQPAVRSMARMFEDKTKPL